MDGYLSIDEAITRLGSRGVTASPRWIREQAQKGGIPGAIKVGSGQHSVWLIPGAWAEEWTRKKAPKRGA